MVTLCIHFPYIRLSFNQEKRLTCDLFGHEVSGKLHVHHANVERQDI